jgi:hypothetical protein
MGDAEELEDDSSPLEQPHSDEAVAVAAWSDKERPSAVLAAQAMMDEVQTSDLVFVSLAEAPPRLDEESAWFDLIALPIDLPLALLEGLLEAVV